MKPDRDRYSIRGGKAGYDRLLLLARKSWPGTSRFFERVGLSSGMHCADVGCGGGAVSLEMARRVGPGGSVVGLDMDQEKLDLARGAAVERGITNVEFRSQRAQAWVEAERYDAVYSRFLLQHLTDPVDLLRRMWAAVRPGGVLMIEDADHDAWFCYPPNAGFEFFRRTLGEVIDRQGGDHAIGRKLVSRFREAEIPSPRFEVATPVFLEGEEKRIPWSTLDATADSIVAERIATREAIAAALHELEGFAEDSSTLMIGPNVFQLSSRKPRPA
jgi:SAM-dependent methyltransferase